MKQIFQLLRVHQYLKNGIIFLPLFFALRIKEVDLLGKTALVALGFSFCASAIYILNDIMDRKADANHPVKKDRPIASGAISLNRAGMILGVMLSLGLGIIASVSIEALYIALGYIGLNILYSVRLKHVPILDITMISIGFVLRIFVGAAVGDIPVSMWIILMSFLLALFLALAKRRDDVLLANMGKEVRKSIDGYNLEFINGGMIIMASVTIVSYISYTISPEQTERFGTDKLYLTVIFVILGILRYLQLTFVEQKSGNPTKLLIKDAFLQMTIVAWFVSLVLLIYGD